MLNAIKRWRMRREAREGAFKLIFETLFKDAEEETLIEVTSPLKKEADKAFCKEIFDKYLSHKEELDEVIKKNLTNFDFDRVYRIDLALVYLALAEIKYLDTPKPVAIDEVLEIAKKYSTFNSSKFINGLLSAIIE